ncbi:hypothetical protein GGR55DRAFT_619021 [Xylaria sp. FL0064]|nr:hypothetical protein GGR55DRAFT_619021 [Xylaria sp. FL0064]
MHTTSRHHHKSPNGKMEDSMHDRVDRLKGLFRNNTEHHPSGSANEVRDHHRRELKPRRPLSLEALIRSAKDEKPAAAPVQESLPGTRGLFIPAYRCPEHFAQWRRRNNPTRPLPVEDKQQFRDGSRVIVRFFNCENTSFGGECLISPDLKSLVSAACAFLGECQINDTPYSQLPSSPNPAYRGLDVQGAQGGYHLHFPDHAGARPFSNNIYVDWDRIMRNHARNFTDTVLLVGVGSGEPSTRCCY